MSSKKKEEVMQPERPIDQHAVAPPPVSEAGGDHLCEFGRFSSWRDCPEHNGDMHTNDEKTNMTDETCIHSGEKLAGVPLPEPAFHGVRRGGLLREDAYTADQLRAYGDEKCARETAALLGLIADIRKAAGDHTGKLMQAELVELIGRQREECDKAKEAEESDFESMEMYRRARDRADRITAAARAVVDRWETPLWKDAPATAGFIYALRDAIAVGGVDEHESN